MAGAGYTLFTAGQTLTAAQVNTYLEQQTMMVFASAAARDTALASVLSEGLHAYLLDVNTITVYSGATWSTTGPAHGALLSWTPAVTQSGSVTVTVSRAVYSRVGRTVWCMWDLAVTGTGSAGVQINISLPVTAAGSNDNYLGGFAKVFDTSAATTYMGVPGLASSSLFKLYNMSATSTGSGFLGSTGFAAALASGDGISGSFSYEAGGDA